MSVATQSVKPYRWAVTPNLVDPTWGWAWRGLIGGWLFWEGGTAKGITYDISPGHISPIDSQAGSPSFAPTRLGMALETNGATQVIWASDSPRLRAPGTAITVVVAFQRNGTSESWGTLLTKRYDQSADPYNSYSLSQNGATGNSLLFTLSTGSPGSQVLTSAVASLPQDVPLLAVGVWPKEGTATTMEIRVYRLDTGALVGTGTNTFSGPIGYSTPGLYLGASYSSNQNAYGARHLMAAVYDVALRQRQIELLARDPFGPFRMVDEAGIIYAAGAAAPQTVTPGAAIIAAGLPAATIIPGAVTIAPAAVSLIALLPDAARIPGAVSVSPSAMALTSQLPGVTRAAEVTLTPAPVLITTTPLAPAIVPGSVVVTPDGVTLVLAVVAPNAFIGVPIIGTISLPGELALVVSLDGESLIAIPLSALRLLSVDLQGEVP